MDGNLATTNTILTVMAVVSVLEVLGIIGISVAMLMIYRRAMTLLSGLEERHVAPAMTRVHAILDDVKAVSDTVKAETARVDNAIHNTMHRVDDTVDRMRSNVRAKTSRIVGFVRGARVALETILQSRAA
jgi:hypothetical protein